MPPAPPDSKITSSTHPEYKAEVDNWEKFRLVFAGGEAFKDEYLKKFSIRETQADFNDRFSITPVPAHAKAAVIDIKNAIFQRLVDIVRIGGDKSYKSAIDGLLGGVDFAGNTMTGFIGRLVLPELLSMRKVGVYVDKPQLPEGASLLDTKDIRPYIYKYDAEDIRSWAYDGQGRLISLLLRDHEDELDANGLVISIIKSFRLIRKTQVGITVETFDAHGDPTQEETILLNIKEIPFAVFELSMSLLQDVADHQIALLNMGSSDVNYAIKSNFPFYTEQINPMAQLPNIKQPGDSGEAASAGAASTSEIKVGVTQGRGYPKGLERPGFIHPSPEPLLASMKKQAELREEIRLLVNLSLTNIEPRRESAESKALDEHSLEAGLSYIGLELEYGERQIAEFWASYERSDVAVINYPTNYSLRSEEDRRAEAKELQQLQAAVPSQTYQRALAKEIASITVSHRVDEEDLKKIHAEIEASPTVQIDSKTILADLKEGLVSSELASTLRGYPKGEAAKAQAEIAERIAKSAESSVDDPNRRVDPDGDVNAKQGEENRGEQKLPKKDE